MFSLMDLNLQSVFKFSTNFNVVWKFPCLINIYGILICRMSNKTYKSSLIFEIFCDIGWSTYFYMYDSWNNKHKIALVLSFSKRGLPFFTFIITGDMKDFHVFFSINWNFNKILNIFGIFSVKNGRPHFEMVGL